MSADDAQQSINARVIETLIAGLLEAKELGVHVQHNAQNIEDHAHRLAKIEQALFYANGQAFAVRLQKLEEGEKHRALAAEATIKGRWTLMAALGPQVLAAVMGGLGYLVTQWLGKSG